MFNFTVFIGRLTADAELKYTTNNIPVTSFSIAVERRYQQGGERITDFINCVAWRNTGEFISKYFKKGDPITIQGELQTRKYTETDTGKTRTAYEIIVNEARFVPQKANNNGAPASNDFAEFTPTGDDDLPF